jgi:hypothetical protein
MIREEGVVLVEGVLRPFAYVVVFKVSDWIAEGVVAVVVHGY